MDQFLTTFEGLQGLFIFILTPLMVLIVSLIATKYPPKSISKTYGYRTKMSMKNADTWAVANAYSNRKMLQVSILGILISALIWLIFPESLGFACALLISVALLFGVILATEKLLKETFDKEGNRK